MMTHWDGIPIETRRENWGWFGTPWPSGICYLSDDDGCDTDEVNWPMQKQTPVGEPCLWCDEPFVEGDQGSAMPMVTAERTTRIAHQHKECSLRSVVGSYAHLTSNCPSDGRCNHIDTGMTLREDALAVWDFITKNGMQ